MRALTRPRLTGAVAVACLAGVAASGDRLPLLTVAFAWGVVLASGRSRLPWASRLPFGRTVRRSLRVLVFAAALPFLGVPYTRVSAVGVLLGLGLGVVGVASQWRAVRLGLSRRYLALLPPIGPADRARDVLLFGTSGLAQEYLYRGIALSALTAATNAAVAVVVTSAMFAVEHALQFDAAESWDRRDYATHVVMGLVLAPLVLVTHCLLLAVLAHTCYDLPQTVQALIRPSAAPPRPSPAWEHADASA